MVKQSDNVITSWYVVLGFEIFLIKTEKVF